MSKLKISDLTPDDKNYNKGTQFGNSLIEKSLRKFGAGRSILLDKNNRIIAGNKTIENAYTIGLDDVLVVETTGNQIVAVKRMDIDLDSKIGRELALADNATSKANIDWDYDNIQQDWEISEQEEWGIDNSAFVKELEADEDDFDITPPEIPITVLGDLYEIGEHRLLCGDSTDSDQVAKLMDGQKADMVFTDPPYGMFLDTDYSQIKGSKKSIGFKGNKVGNKYEKIIGDNEDFTTELINTIFASFPKCKEVFIWGADYFVDLLPNYGKDGSWLVWSKRSSDAQQRGIGNCFELCWSMTKHKRFVLDFEWFGFLSKDDPKEARNRVHPSMKPSKLIGRMVNEFCKDAQIIADIFIGSGTTMVAAHQLKRKCYGMELDPKYCDVIVNRMIALDPDIKIKLNGKPFEKAH